MRVLRLSLPTLVLTTTLAATAAAQGAPGVRAGVSGDPDQLYIGGHYETAPLVDRLRFRPNVEAGFGDDVTLIAFNFEFTYGIPIKGEPWALYVGGGPAINLYSFDRGNADDDTDTEPGLNFLFGVGHRNGFFAEFKVGAIDSPDFKFGIGYTFR